MEYVLYVPGMPFHGGSISGGRSLGGSESAGYYLARELAARGHGVTVFSEIPPGGAGDWEGVRYLPIGARGEAAPFGEGFESYAAATPHDVLIAQRVPGLFHRRMASKVNLWWSHDLALRRHLPAMNRQLWNLSAVLCVSEFHKEQVGQVYGLKPERIAVVPNGVDAALFGDPLPPPAKRRGKTLVYSSRPERGLENLLGDGSTAPGIMERLAETDPAIRLKVCGYDNTAPELAGYYAHLRERCRALPNVEWLGALSKQDLARLMREAWLHVYPTTFEEVSCITAMEAQCAGTPIVTSPVAALPETLRDGGVHWVPLVEGNPTGAEPVDENAVWEGAVDRAAFATEIAALAEDPERYARLCANAREKSRAYGWRGTADAVEAVAAECLARQIGEPGRMARHLMRHSDIPALRRQLDSLPDESNPIVERTREELRTCYRFAEEGNFARHYADYYAYEKERGVAYGPEDLAGNPRFEWVAGHVSTVAERVERAGSAEGGTVLDYGCAHGHFTINLARRFPHLRFIGIDLVASNIATAIGWAESEGLENVSFLQGGLAEHGESLPPLALVLAAEVLEHVAEPGRLADALAGHLAKDGRMLLTTPYGPWEAQGYARHHPWRAHLHHLERADLTELFGHHPGFAVQAVPAGRTSWGEPLGSWVTSFGKPRRPGGSVNLARKLSCQAPRETLSVCMIVGGDSDTLARCLKSILPLADEVILGIDDSAGGAERGSGGDGGVGRHGPGHAWELAERYGARAFALASPLAEGFAAARNATIERARGDWILWIDDDEELLWPERLPKYLRDNGYDAYALKQHHFAVEPGGVIKTDFPCRLFRNRRGFRFHGLVHEHPELAYNQGAGHVLLLPDLAICHNGYVTEEVRRGRFQRNLPLMLRDREVNQDRLLGRFLWIRDLAHLNRFEFERSRTLSPKMRERAREAVALWRGLLDEGQVRMAVDALPYYSEAANLLTGGGIACKLQLGLAHPALHQQGLGDPDADATALEGQFVDKNDIAKLTQALLKEKTGMLEGKYV